MVTIYMCLNPVMTTLLLSCGEEIFESMGWDGME